MATTDPKNLFRKLRACELLGWTVLGLVIAWTVEVYLVRRFNVDSDDPILWPIFMAVAMACPFLWVMSRLTKSGITLGRFIGRLPPPKALVALACDHCGGPRVLLRLCHPGLVSFVIRQSAIGRGLPPQG